MENYAILRTGTKENYQSGITEKIIFLKLAIFFFFLARKQMILKICFRSFQPVQYFKHKIRQFKILQSMGYASSHDSLYNFYFSLKNITP
jgi:hypothetical protein